MFFFVNRNICQAYEFVDDKTKYVAILQHYSLWADNQPVM